MRDAKGTERRAIFSRLFGNNIAWMRDLLARMLVRAHVGPDLLTYFGLMVTLFAGVLLGLGAGDKVGGGGDGRSWYGFWAGLLIIAASSFDILDGAVARIGNQVSRRGAFLDSCFDRVGDGLIFTGIMVYYLRHREIEYGEIFAVSSVVALANAEIISYVKARAENFISSFRAGYWQRGERIAAILIGLFSGHVGTVMVMLAIFPAFTVVRRIYYGGREIAREEQGVARAGGGNVSRLMFWRVGRGRLGYDIATAIYIIIILLVDLQRL